MEIKPMLLTEVWDKNILEDASKYFQVKENGVRALVHVKDGKVVGIRNRSNLPILYMFPEFRGLEFPFKAGILDAEICVFKDGKSVYYGGIDHRRSAPTENTLAELPARMVVFDALMIEAPLVMKPYKHRYQKVLESVKENDKVIVAKNFEAKALWQAVTNQNLEGVVIKNPNAMYEVGKRSKEYLKLKNYKLTEVVVSQTEANDKGTKVFGKALINGAEIDVECQLAGQFDVPVGSKHTIKYLDIAGSRLIQPTKVSREQISSCAQIVEAKNDKVQD